MGVADAQTARGMAQRIQAALPTIQENFFNQAALLKLIQTKNQIKWGGSHTSFDWYIRNVPTGQNPEWGGGELAVRTFEEQNPANKLELPYCWLERTYGVSDKTLEANRHAAGKDKIYDSLKENLNLATIFMYDTFGPSIYTGSGVGSAPSGMLLACGTPYETTSTVTVAALAAYAGKTMTTAGVVAYNKNRITAGFDDNQFAPSVACVQELPGTSNDTWSGDCVVALAAMSNWMSRTAGASGTGRQVLPDSAFMNEDPFGALTAKLAANQSLYNIPLGNKALNIAGWANVQVGGITCYRDTNVPDDSGGLERVLVADSNQIKICTTHTKKEGLIKNEFDANLPLISGAIGVLKMNMNFMVSSPTVLGCMTGAND